MGVASSPDGMKRNIDLLSNAENSDNLSARVGAAELIPLRPLRPFFAIFAVKSF